MQGAILTQNEFLATFGSGDVFWFMVSHDDRPVSIEGPYRILSFEKDQIGICISCIDQRNGRHYEHYVSDLTNRWHGAFRSQEEGLVYLNERKHAYATDPQLISEATYARLNNQMLSKMLSEAIFDDLWGVPEEV